MNLVDHFLISMHSDSAPHFKDAVIYVCEHNESGAKGVVINQASDITVSDLFERIEIDVPNSAHGNTIKTMPVLKGGPVQDERGFVLHDLTHQHKDYRAMLLINQDTDKHQERALTTSKDVLEAVSKGQGPHNMLVTLGYSGWGAGQLEHEMINNTWLSIPAGKRAGDVLWNTPIEERKAAAIRLLGIDPNGLTLSAGHG